LMPTATYLQRRGQLETYFDRTASDAWKRMTSDAPLGRIRATVRAGREQMRETLLGWLPDDLTGARLLDAGCGTGVLAMAAAERGAHVVAIDLAGSLVSHARDGSARPRGAGTVEFRVGDMLDPALGTFDYVVAMDSLIHYRTADVVRVLGQLAARTHAQIVFTFAPRTPLLATMHAVGRLFPRSDRAPAIEPVAQRAICRRLRTDDALETWQIGRTRRIASGFYTSQAMELRRG
jgi:magnesium-protoporphyrin O-methyltransferase